jgi:SAM-dependent methyltransferase
MLREHLSQAHDLASRRSALIDQHVSWIHRCLLGERPSRILDLGCGPGLYTSRLAALGHHCLGIDISPASIEYAKAHTFEASGSASYRLGDMRHAEYGTEFDLAMLIFGELNTFTREDAGSILRKARDALSPGGILLLEAHSFESVRSTGLHSSSWRTAESSVFSDRPHLVLREHFWHAAFCQATERTYVIDAESSAVERYVESLQAYTTEDYRALLRASGLSPRETLPSLPGSPDNGEFVVIVASARDESTAR